ncbi:MAG: excinuclease ABC subunit A, partial [Haloarculaceae archaeon]
EDSYTGRYLRDLLPAVDLEGPRADRTVAPLGADGDQATGAGDD